jgi:phosphoglycerate dehydrogenase-like enzyme
MNPKIIVTYEPDAEERKIYRNVLEDLSQVHYLKDASKSNRSQLLNAADIVIALSFFSKEIDPAEISLLQNARFIQLIYAGADNIPFEFIPEDIILASNVGAFAGPIAEHVLALTLALAKNLVPKNKQLQEGKFDRSGFNQEIRGGVCGIIGFGGNGKEIAKIMQAMGMQIYGINREKELGWMKKDAILINVGRGDVINQKALYEHLKANPDFRAGIDTWWSEPVGQEAFNLAYPFFDLSNIIGSPHIADHVPGSMTNAIRRALENVKNYLMGNEMRGVLRREDYLK